MLHRLSITAALLLVTSVPVLAGHSPKTPHPEAERARIEKTLDRIDTPDFLRAPVAIASGHNTVKVGFLATPEVKALLAAPTVAVPAMLARLGRPHGLRDPSTRIVYFLAFERMKDRRTLPALARYVDGLPDSEGTAAGVPSHPFRYAADALQAQLPPGPPVKPDMEALFHARQTDALFRARHALAARVRALPTQRAASPSRPS